MVTKNTAASKRIKQCSIERFYRFLRICLIIKYATITNIRLFSGEDASNTSASSVYRFLKLATVNVLHVYTFNNPVSSARLRQTEPMLSNLEAYITVFHLWENVSINIQIAGSEGKKE